MPYAISHAMDQSQQCPSNVFFRGKAAYLHNENYVDVDKVLGDEPSAGLGVVSATHVQSHNIDQSATLYVNGWQIVRTGDEMWMNCRKPG